MLTPQRKYPYYRDNLLPCGSCQIENRPEQNRDILPSIKACAHCHTF